MADRHCGPRSRLSRGQRRQQRDDQLYAPLRELGAGAGHVLVGLDEVGRGALAGPLTVAAVALPLSPRVSGLEDSKCLSPRRREELCAQIETVALGIGIAHIQPEQIDALGLSAALRQVFAAALVACDISPQLVLVDGRPLGIHPQERAIVKGDSKVACIAAASIVAKVCRDAIMVQAAITYSNYGWETNKGYGSASHIAAIKERGLCPLHRRSFCRSFLPTLFSEE